MKNKRTKQIIGIMAVVVLLLTFGFFAIASGDDNSTDMGIDETEKEEITKDIEVVETEKNENNNNLGKYKIEIISCRIEEDYRGRPIVIVKYSFTNNSNNSKSFAYTFKDSIYQNGVELNRCYAVADGVEYLSDNYSKEIKEGTTLEVERAYNLNDSTTDLEVEIKELISFNDKVIRKTFKIETEKNENNTSNQPDEEGEKNNNLGQYMIEILSYRIEEDYEGKPIVIVKYSFTNNSENSANFDFTFEDNVYQNGIGLNNCYFVADDVEYLSDNSSKDIKKGATLEVEKAYVLNDTNTDIEIEISELISFSDKKVTKIFKIK